MFKRLRVDNWITNNKGCKGQQQPIKKLVIRNTVDRWTYKMIPSLHNSINSTKTEGFFACQINEMGKKLLWNAIYSILKY